MAIRERVWHGVIVLAALVALVIGVVGIVSISARSFPAMAHATASELGGFPGSGEHDGQVGPADQASRPDGNCFWMDDGNGNGSWICVPKLAGVSNLQSFSNQPFTPHSRL